MDKRHEILVTGMDGLQVRCACGAFLLDKDGPGLVEVSLGEITAAVTAHYLIAAHPERFNGHKEKPHLIEGKGSGLV